MKKLEPLSALFLMGLLGCGGTASVTSTQIAYAKPRPSECSLALAEVDVTQVEFNQRWDLLAYVTTTRTDEQDPLSPKNRELVRPRACAFGGTHIALGMNSATTAASGRTGGGTVYMVLRPKQEREARPF